MKLASWLRSCAAIVIVCAAVLFVALPAAAQTTTVSSTYLGGVVQPTASGTIYWQPMQALSIPLGGARVGTASGQIRGIPYTTSIANGVTSLSIPDALATNPNICYAVTAIDGNGNIVIGMGLQADGIHVNPGGAYGAVQPTGGTWSLDTYIPGVIPTILPATLFSAPITNTLSAGSSATAAVALLAGQYQLTFGIPAGTPGAAGAAGATGATGPIGGSLSYPGVTTNSNNGMTISGTPSNPTDAATVGYLTTQLATKASSTAGITINSTSCTLSGSCTVTAPSLVPLGTWNSGTSYTAGQMVLYSDGFNYACVTGCTAGVLPTSATNWMKISSASLSQLGGMSFAQQASLRTKLPLGTANLFNATTVTTSSYVKSDGTLGSSAGFTASDYIPCNSNASMLTSNALANNGAAGTAFYDASQVFISWFGTAVAAGGTWACPSNAAFVRITVTPANVAGEMVVNGTTVPSPYIAFGGTDNASVLSNAVRLALAYSPAAVVNLFNQAAVATNSLLVNNTGAITTSGATGYYVSAFIPVFPGQSISVSKTASSGSGFGGVVFYDINQAYISQSAGLASIVGTYTAPAFAYYVRISSSNDNLPTQMVVSSSSVPTVYVGYQAAAQSAAQVWTSFATAIIGTLSPTFNFFNQATVTSNVLLKSVDGTTQAQSTYFTSAYIPVFPGEQVWWTDYNYGSSSTFAAIVWYDAAKNFISSTAIPLSSGAFTGPAGAAYARVSGSTNNLAIETFTQGTAAPGYLTPYGGAASSAGASRLAGVKIGVFGDSITQQALWQATVGLQTGATFLFQDGRSGRLVAQAFECYGAATAGATLSTFNTTYTNCGAKLGVGQTVGDTLATDLTNVKLMLVNLGTNNFGETIGTIGDLPSANTLNGDLNYVVTTLLTANPAMHIVITTPGYSAQVDAARAAVATAEEAFGNYWGIPVLNMTKRCGINSLNSATWTLDGIHPNAASGTNFYGPCIADFLNQIY